MSGISDDFNSERQDIGERLGDRDNWTEDELHFDPESALVSPEEVPGWDQAKESLPFRNVSDTGIFTFGDLTDKCEALQIFQNALDYMETVKGELLERYGNKSSADLISNMIHGLNEANPRHHEIRWMCTQEYLKNKDNLKRLYNTGLMDKWRALRAVLVHIVSRFELLENIATYIWPDVEFDKMVPISYEKAIEFIVTCPDQNDVITMGQYYARHCESPEFLAYLDNTLTGEEADAWSSVKNGPPPDYVAKPKTSCWTDKFVSYPFDMATPPNCMPSYMEKEFVEFPLQTLPDIMRNFEDDQVIQFLEDDDIIHNFIRYFIHTMQEGQYDVSRIIESGPGPEIEFNRLERTALDECVQIHQERRLSNGGNAYGAVPPTLDP